MQEITFEVKRDRLDRYGEVFCLLFGFFIIGWLLWRLGFGKASRKWVQSLEYRLGQDYLMVSSCVSLWGLVLSRQEKSIPLTMITDVKLMQGPLLNKMDLWILHIQTASTGQKLSEATLCGLENPQEARDQILEAIQESFSRRVEKPHHSGLSCRDGGGNTGDNDAAVR